jgi:hypothetical protein
MDSDDRSDQEAAFPPVALRLVADSGGEIVGAVEFAETLVQTQELLRELP